MTIVEESEVQRRYTITIPRRIREALALKEGSKVKWQVDKGRIVITPKSFKIFKDRFKGRSRYETSRDKEQVERVFIEAS